jgi:hypothetical protein
MLLGGFGFLSRLHGLSVDNVVEVEMALADGRIVVVNENEHSGPGTYSFVAVVYIGHMPRVGLSCPRCVSILGRRSNDY